MCQYVVTPVVTVFFCVCDSQGKGGMIRGVACPHESSIWYPPDLGNRLARYSLKFGIVIQLFHELLELILLLSCLFCGQN